jgi:hypothetical protein
MGSMTKIRSAAGNWPVRDEDGAGGAIVPTKAEGGAYALAVHLALTTAVSPVC